VLDFGCGYGAFASFLKDWNPRAAYLGFDISSAMVEVARSSNATNAATFVTDEAALEPVEVVVASGIFNVKLDVPAEQWRAYVFDRLGRIASLAKDAFAFNILTAYSDPRRMRGDLYYADPHELFDWCRTHYSPWVGLLHDYGLYEFTVVAKKAP
jgi:SAM-dependent methyltransferase